MNQTLIIQVSGACTGSVGLMGVSGIITEKENYRCLHTFDECKGTGTIHKAVYLALLKAVECLYELRLRPAKLLIQSDSHFLLCRINQKMQEADSEMQELRNKIWNLIDELHCEARFIWIPYEENKRAIALAQKCIGMPIALVNGYDVIEWQENNCTIDEEHMVYTLPEVNADTVFQIKELNKSDSICPTRIISLISNGMDKYSRAKAEDLLRFIEIRFGAYTRDYMIRTLSGCDINYCKGVLRWVARGLKPNIAFIKANLEIQIKDIS